MSTLTLEDVKAAISVTHNDDDDLILRLMESAARECAYTKYGIVPDYDAEDAVADDPLTLPECAQGIILMVRADYEADPADREKYLAAAKSLWLAGSGWTL
jgi:hypothetical protein